MKRQAGTLDLFLGEAFTLIMGRLEHYVGRVKERLEIMEKAQEKRTAPYRYLKEIREWSPKHPDDWSGDLHDVCVEFLFGVDDPHRSSAENIGGSDQHRVSDFCRKLDGRPG